MLHFYITRKASFTGKRVVNASCERCSAAFQYEMVRTGTGEAQAHYGLFLNAAQQKAERIAEEDLAHRLETEADLVPCPKCKWVNQDFVRRDRGVRHVWMTKAAVIVWAIVGVVALFYFLGHQSRVPRDAEWLWLIGRSLVVGAVPGCSILFLQRWLRRRVNPNRYLPV
jgi:hypothetical protein